MGGVRIYQEDENSGGRGLDAAVKTRGKSMWHGNSGDGIVYVALAFSALAAVLFASADPSVTYQKLRWLLMQHASAEGTTADGAIGERMTFPVSPRSAVAAPPSALMVGRHGIRENYTSVCFIPRTGDAATSRHAAL